MSSHEDKKRINLSVTDIDDPLPTATFGSIGRYVDVDHPTERSERFTPRLLTIAFDEKQAEHVDLWTLMLFRVDLESREFSPVDSSHVDVDKREVSAWIDQPGTYGLIGLPKHLGVLETLRLIDRFGPQLLEERERGEHGLHDRICGLILCADPTTWDPTPTGSRGVCETCLGLDPSWKRLPEKYLLERMPDLPQFRELVEADTSSGGPTLLAWGSNASGQLGDGSLVERRTPVPVVPRLLTKKIVAPSTGDWTLALATDGTVWAWGFNASGQLGDGTLVVHRSTPARVGLLDKVVDVAAGPTHGVAVRSDGSVWRWGWPGPSASQPDRLPVRVTGLADIVAVAAGFDFTLALRRDGRVFAWGANGSGQLGDGSQTFRTAPTQVSGLTAVRSISAGFSTSMAIISNGAVFGWGSFGLLGNGSVVNERTPIAIPGLTNIEQVSLAGHGLARTTAGEVWFWGNNFDGEAGDGTGSGVRPTPVRVPGLQNITDIAAGGWHNLALQSNGTVWAWGSNFAGEIGIGVGYTQPTPRAVPLSTTRVAVGVGAGERFSFAILG